MHLQQREQMTLPHAMGKRKGRLAFLLIASLLFMVTLSFPGNTGTVHAASTSANSKPATSGGGCRSDGYLEACISVNSAGEVEPDIYILHADMCDITITLQKDGWDYTSDYDNNCYAKGTHLYGFATDAVAGHTWRTVIFGSLGEPSAGYYTVYSPYQYT